MRRHTLVLLSLLMLVVPLVASAQQGAAFVMEQTYWVKPGKTNQFIALFKKNKLPGLQAEKTKGRVLWIRMAQPRTSAGNEQWDFRVTVGWRDAQSAWGYEEPARPANGNGRDAQRLSIEDTLSEELIVERTDVLVQESAE
ncbi:hypothetical protein [Thermomonas sp.]|uniref:hypothetical protein n=1 Tax=Thermomonas sp. TaxID=1971895 RepID=UPI0024881B85|nr:hypothetical protein [Thermomonas sp.]MDI1253081.1 hypothetical protein [Thermomonas sp.]